MKKLKISLIAIALIIGGVQAYGGAKFQTYYCVENTEKTDVYYEVASSSPSLTCIGVQDYQYVCTFSSHLSLIVGQQVPSGAAYVLSTYF